MFLQYYKSVRISLKIKVIRKIEKQPWFGIKPTVPGDPPKLL